MLSKNFKRKENGLIHNFIKWVAIRCAYVLYRLGFTANSIDLVGLFLLFPAYYFLYISLIDFNLYLFLASYFTILLVLAIDFMDGVLAKVNKYEYAVGERIDDLSPEIIRFMSSLLIGYLSQNTSLFIISVLSGILQQTYVANTSVGMKQSKLLSLIRGKYSLHSIRILSFITAPTLTILYLFEFNYIKFILLFYILLNFILNLIWIAFSLKEKKLK